MAIETRARRLAVGRVGIEFRLYLAANLFGGVESEHCTVVLDVVYWQR